MHTWVDISMKGVGRRPKINQRHETSASSKSEASFIDFNVQTDTSVVLEFLDSDPMLVHKFDPYYKKKRFDVDFRDLLIPEKSQPLILPMITSMEGFSAAQIEFIEQHVSSWVPVLSQIAWDGKAKSLEVFVDIKLTVKKSITEFFAGTSDKNDIVEGSFTYPALRSSVMLLRKERYVDKEEEHCAICLNEFERGVKVVKMPCSHIFHNDCILRWLQSKKSCPLCRSGIPTSENLV